MPTCCATPLVAAFGRAVHGCGGPAEVESVQPASTVSRMKSNSRFEVATEAALRRALVSGVIASVVLAGIIGLILIFTVGVLLGLVVGVVLFVGASAGWMLYVQSAFGDAASSVLEGGGAAAGEDEYPSFRNALEGVAILTGVRVPALRVLDHGSANAMVAQGLEEDATVVVTTGLLENCRIVEAEVLAAELLCRVRDGSARYCTLAAGLPGPVRAAAGLDGGAVAALIGDQRAVLGDADAVSVTKYPPGLIAALERMAQQGTEVPTAVPDQAPLWIAPAVGVQRGVSEPVDRSVNQPLDYRIAVLREL